MRRQLLILAFLGACGSGSSTPGGDDEPPNDGTPVATMVTITGRAVEQSANDPAPLQGVLVEAFRNSDENTVVTMAMTDANGDYTLTVQTNGQALDGYLKATLGGLIDSYLYPPAPISEDFDGASINMITTQTRGLLTSVLACDDNQGGSNGMIAMLVYNVADVAVAGAVVSSQPAASSDCYNTANLPDGDAAGTFTDGIGYMFNVTGMATVSATATGLTFPSHQVNARPGTFTTTLIKAQ